MGEMERGASLPEGVVCRVTPQSLGCSARTEQSNNHPAPRLPGGGLRGERWSGGPEQLLFAVESIISGILPSRFILELPTMASQRRLDNGVVAHQARFSP